MRFSILFLYNLLLVVVPQIPDKPNFPTTFFTNLVVKSLANNTSNPSDGFLAQNIENELFFEQYIFPESPSDPNGHKLSRLYNKNAYGILDIYDGNGPYCLCVNTTFKNAGLPFFSEMVDFKYIGKNETMVWWEFRMGGFPGSIQFVFYVENTAPGTPTIPVEMGTISVKPPTYYRTRFSGFQTGTLNDHFFEIPEECRNATCNNIGLDPISPFSPGIFSNEF